MELYKGIWVEIGTVAMSEWLTSKAHLHRTKWGSGCYEQEVH